MQYTQNPVKYSCLRRGRSGPVGGNGAMVVHDLAMARPNQLDSFGGSDTSTSARLDK